MLKDGLEYFGINFDYVKVNHGIISTGLGVTLHKEFAIPYDAAVSSNHNKIFEATIGKFLDEIKTSQYFQDLEEELTKAKETIKELEKYKIYYELHDPQNDFNIAAAQQQVQLFAQYSNNRCKCK